MLEALMKVGAFVLEHADLIDAIREAVDGGTSKQDLLKVIRASMVAASDAAMREELDG